MSKKIKFYNPNTSQWETGDADNAERLGGKLPEEYEKIENKGEPDGYASLDETGNIPLSQLGNVEGMEMHGNEWHTEEFETTDGAQQKANQAETNAKNYTDDEIDIVNTDLQNFKQKQNDIHTDTIEPTGFPNRIDSKISFDDSTRTFTIEPTNTEYHVYSAGNKFIKSTQESIQIGDVDGMWYVYFDLDGTLKVSQTSFFSDLRYIMIGLIYWNSTQQKAVYFADERHGVTMDKATHAYLHNTQGSKYRDGLIAGHYNLAGNGDQDSDAQLSISNGSFYDEDILHKIIHSDNPQNPLEQELTPVAKMPILYRSGQDMWSVTDKQNFPLLMGTNLPQINIYDNEWMTVDASDNSHIAMYVFVTNNIYAPMITIMGQREDETINDAKNNNRFEELDLSGVPFEEFRVLYRLIFQVSTNYTNQVKARLVDIEDLRNVSALQISAITSERHNTLSGRTEYDSHPASAISISPISGISGNNVQSGIEEVNQAFNAHLAEDEPHANATILKATEYIEAKAGRLALPPDHIQGEEPPSAWPSGISTMEITSSSNYPSTYGITFSVKGSGIRNLFQFYSNRSGTNIWVRVADSTGSSFSTWVKMWYEGNTIVDANGFIKEV